MALLFLQYPLRIKAFRCLVNARRWKSKEMRWASKTKTNTSRALDNFDSLYLGVFKDQWTSLRLGLLCAEKQCVVVNNFGDKERVIEELERNGAFNVRKIYMEQQKFMKDENFVPSEQASANVFKVGEEIDQIIKHKQLEDVDLLYPEATDPVKAIDIAKHLQQDTNEENSPDSKILKVSSDPTVNTPLSESLKNVHYDSSRLITPSPSGAPLGASIYEFVPATKLKGMEDYISESSHYNYFKDGTDFPIEVQHEDWLNFPKNLDVYSYERGNCESFPPSYKGSTGMQDYHICNMGLLAPVLALGLEAGDRVLDMRAGNGDSSVFLGQTLLPSLLVVNNKKPSLTKSSYFTLNSLFYDIKSDSSPIVFAESDGLCIEDTECYNKILISVPSTHDRNAVTVEGGNYFSPTNVQKRVKLPELQAEYLRKALELVEEGGAVVYCTHSLSPVQNEGVVRMALNELWKETDCKFVIKDLTNPLKPLQPFMEISKGGEFGHLVLPFLPKNCGPVYICKIVKTVHSIPNAE